MNAEEIRLRVAALQYYGIFYDVYKYRNMDTVCILASNIIMRMHNIHTRSTAVFLILKLVRECYSISHKYIYYEY